MGEQEIAVFRALWRTVSANISVINEFIPHEYRFSSHCLDYIE